MFRNISAITFKIGTYCDLDCTYCFQQHDIKEKNKIFSIYKDAIKFLQNKKITYDDNLEIKVTGGEPSLYWFKFITAYKQFKKIERTHPTHVYMSSIFNGTHIEKMLMLMKKGILNPYSCKLSWDGIHSSSKSRLPKSSYYNDDYFKAIVQTLGESPYGKDVLVRIALTNDTIDDMVDSFKYALDCGCNKIEYYFLTDYPPYESIPFRSKFKKVLERLIQLKIERNFLFANWETLEFSNSLNNKKDLVRAINCRHLGKMLYIEQDGNIAPCGYFSKDALFGNEPFYIGNIYEGFYKDKVQEFINQYKEVPMCYNKQCPNMHCFECPAVNLYKNKKMQSKLYQQCALRNTERKLYNKYKNSIPYSNQSTRAYSYIDDFKVDYSLPDLPYKGEF